MITCKYCIIEKGITGKDGFETEEEFFEHIEMVHDIAVRRPGESHEEALERVREKNPRIGTDDCQCPGCKERRRLKYLFFNRGAMN